MQTPEIEKPAEQAGLPGESMCVNSTQNHSDKQQKTHSKSDTAGKQVQTPSAGSIPKGKVTNNCITVPDQALVTIDLGDYIEIPDKLATIPQWSVHKEKIPLNKLGQDVESAIASPANNGNRLLHLTIEQAITFLEQHDGTGLSFDFKGTPYAYCDLDTYKKNADKSLHEHLKGLASDDTYVETSLNGGTHIVYEGERFASTTAIDNRGNNLLYMTGDSIGLGEVGKLSKEFMRASGFVPAAKVKKYEGDHKSNRGNRSLTDCQAAFAGWCLSHGDKSLGDYNGDRSEFTFHLMNGARFCTDNHIGYMVSLVATKMNGHGYSDKRLHGDAVRCLEKSDMAETYFSDSEKVDDDTEIIKVEDLPEVKNMTTDLKGLVDMEGIFKLGMAGLMARGMPSIEQYAFPVVATAIARAISGKITCQGVWPNIFAVKVGGTSSGKTESDKELARQLFKAGLKDFVGITDIASGAGLYRALEQSPRTMLCMDEATSIFRKYSTKDPIADDKRDAIMDVFSKSGMKVTKSYGSASKSIDVESPCLTFIGNSTPLIFNEVTTEDFISGMIPRFDFYCYDGRVPYRGIKSGNNNQLTAFVDGLKALIGVKYSGGGNVEGQLEPVEIVVAPDCQKLMESYSDNITDTINSLPEDSLFSGIISRKYHGAIKYALIHIAGTRQPADIFKPMQVVDLQWGIDVVTTLGSWKTKVLGSKVTTGVFHRDCILFKSAIEAVVRSRRRPTVKMLQSKRPAINNWDTRQLSKVALALVQRGEIKLDESRAKTAYFLAGEKF